eukprot:4939791-Pyramimonas_sp.AAC.1
MQDRFRSKAVLCSTPLGTSASDVVTADAESSYPLPPEKVSALDLVERETRRAARRGGHAHPLAVSSACTHDGKCIGFAHL